jgi:hypothetical protein
VTTKSALSRYHCQPCSSCQLLPPLQLVLVQLGVVISVHVGVTERFIGGSDKDGRFSC